MLRHDCIHFRGDKPCRFDRLCNGCPHFEPFSKKILVIKCRAQGDVLRTTPLLAALKRKYPRSFVIWLVDGESRDLLLHNPFIDRIHTVDLEGVLPLFVSKFDLLICLDKEPGLAGLATKIEARQKFGFGLNEHGNLTIFNPGAEYAYRLGVDDRLKFFENQKTYQEIIHEVAEIPYRRDEYILNLPEEAGEKASRFFRRHRISSDRASVGLNTGAGTKFETKQWPKDHYLQLIKLLVRKLGATVFLLGGPREKVLNLSLERKAGVKVYNTESDNSLLDFAGFVSRMDLVVTSDTLGMHLAIALKKKVIALFGPTCPQEIDLYDRGTKLFASVACSPCYKQSCPDGACMNELTAGQVFEEIKKLL